MAFIRKIQNVHLVVYFTLLFVFILGHLLIKSVKKEILQREHLEELTADLQSTLNQRESLTHLITHKIKGVLARSKAVFSEMNNGTFGELPPMLINLAKRGLDSDNEGVATVDLVLNAANLSKGTIKYDMKLLDFKAIVERVVEEKKPAAIAKNLEMETFYSEGSFTTTGDNFWLTEVVRNLIENAIRYTLKGKISIALETKDSKILFSVKDTGVGISTEDMKNLFKEGGRGKDSVKINVDSTGYGLYTVKLIVDAHIGRVWAESNGNGTTFYLEINLC